MNNFGKCDELIVVPYRSAAEHLRMRLLHRDGAVIGERVLSLDEFTHSLGARLGLPPPGYSNTRRKLILASSIRKLPRYAQFFDTDGMLTEMDSLIGLLAQNSGGSILRREPYAEIFAAYRRAGIHLGATDKHTFVVELIEHLERDGKKIAKTMPKRICFKGFIELSPLLVRLFNTIEKECDVLITQSCHFSETEQLAPASAHHIKPLAPVADALLDYVIERVSDELPIAVSALSSRDDEMLYAAYLVKNAVIKDKLSIRDVKLVAHRSYHDELASILHENGIPCQENTKPSLIGSLINNIVRLHRFGLRRDILIDVLKHPLMTVFLKEYGIDSVPALDRAMRDAQIVGGGNNIERDYLARLDTVTNSDVSILVRKGIETLRELTIPFERHDIKNPGAAYPLVKELLGAVHYESFPDDEQTNAEKLIAKLRDISGIAISLGVPEGKMLESLVSDVLTTEKATKRDDGSSIVITDIQEGRLLLSKLTIVLGLTDDMFPRQNHPPLLIEPPYPNDFYLPDHRANDIESLKQLMLTTEALHLLYTTDGKLPSSPLQRIMKLIGKNEDDVEVNPKDIPPLSQSSLISALTRRGELLSSSETTKKIAKTLAISDHRNNSVRPGVQAGGTVAPPQKISLSAFKSLYKCPLRFFIERCLHIDAPKEVELTVSYLKKGSIIHSALERFWKKRISEFLCSVGEKKTAPQILSCGFNPASARLALHTTENNTEKAKEFLLVRDYNDALSLFEDLVDELLQDEKEKNNLLRSEIEKMRETLIGDDGLLGNYIRWEIENDSVPIAVELPFTVNRLSGKIDRVDRTEDGFLLIDYKSGLSVNPNNTINKLQLAIYSLAVESILPSRESSAALFSFTKGKLFFPAEPMSREDVLAAIDAMDKKIKRGEFHINITEDTYSTCDECPVHSVCEVRFQTVPFPKVKSNIEGME